MTLVPIDDVGPPEDGTMTHQGSTHSAFQGDGEVTVMGTFVSAASASMVSVDMEKGTTMSFSPSQEENTAISTAERTAILFDFDSIPRER